LRREVWGESMGKRIETYLMGKWKGKVKCCGEIWGFIDGWFL
jgi:hypothetical protein